MMRGVLALALLVVGCSSHKAPVTYESRTVTHMEKPFVHDTVTTTKETVLARSANELTVKLEISEGSTTSVHEMKVPLPRADAPPPHDGSTVSAIDETCTVPAGTFQCTRTTVTLGPNSTVTWTTKRVPVPLRSIVTNENMTITTELTRIH